MQFIKDNQKTILLVVGLIVGGILLFTVPLILASFALGYLIVFLKRKELDGLVKKIGISITPALIGSMFAYVFASTVEQFLTVFKSGTGMALVPLSWVKFGVIHNPANNAGRIGFIIGAVLGVIGAYYLAGYQDRRNRSSNTDLVRGRKVLAGGYATKKDVMDRCDFGYPKHGQIAIPLGSMDGQLLSMNPSKGQIKMAGHALVIGATGTGKSFSYIRPQIITAMLAGHSVVVTDPKGELFTDTAKWLEGQGYEIIPFNVANSLHSYRWNMIAECRDMTEILDLAEWAIMSSGDDEAFWSGGEVNLLAAIMGYVKYAPIANLNGGRNIRTALRLLSIDQNVLNERFCDLVDVENIPINEVLTVIEVWQGTQKLFQNYVEGVRNKLRIITKGTLEHLTRASDFTLSDIGAKKTALFLILPEEGEFQALLAPFYAFVFRRLNEKATASGGKLPVPTRFIMDEFANIGRVPDIDKVCALGRSKGIMVHIAVQNIGQLQGLYKRNNAWEAVVGNCPIKLCLGVDDINSARFFTDIMGEAEIEDIRERKDITTPVDRMQLRNRTMITKETDTMKAYEMLQLPDKDCIAILRGRKPIYLQKLGWTYYPQAKDIIKTEKIQPADWPLPISTEEPELIQNNNFDSDNQNDMNTVETDTSPVHEGIFNNQGGI